MKIKYYEINFARKATEEELKNGVAKNGSEICEGLVDSDCSIAIKADHYPEMEEVEEFVKDDLKKFGYDGVYGITPISDWELLTYFDTENIVKDKILTNKLVRCLNCGHEFETTEIKEDYLGKHCICEECGASFDVNKTTGRIDWMEMIINSLPDYSDGIIWSDGGTEILVKTESAANTIADLVTLLYKMQGEDVLINTGYYNPEEDRKNNEEDRYTGWWYVNID